MNHRVKPLGCCPLLLGMQKTTGPIWSSPVIKVKVNLLLSANSEMPRLWRMISGPKWSSPDVA